MSGTEWGGLGLDHRGKAVVFEAAGYSPLGPIAMNCFAPDEANMHLLEQVADERAEGGMAASARRRRHPLVLHDDRAGARRRRRPVDAADDGAARTAGGNKRRFRHRRREMADHRRGRRQIRDHHGEATTATSLGPAGATMFLAPMDAPGIHIERVLDTLDEFMAGGHAVIRLDGLRVPETAVLGKVGEGFRYAQARLAPARLTHCMRWLGAARRAHDIATDYARRRPPSASPWASTRGSASCSPTTRWTSTPRRLAIWHSAWVLDQGERGRHESSMAKVICSEAIWRVVDRSMQILGGLGITDDTIVARIFREVRPFRIYDGPSEVHRWSIAQRILRGG